MSALQGLRRLNKGIKRDLTGSELDRGYIFITKDKEGRRKLGERFTANIQGLKFEDIEMDPYGRIFVGRKIVRGFKDNQIFIKLINRILLIK